MTDAPAPGPNQNTNADLPARAATQIIAFCRRLGRFEDLMGAALVRLVYFIGLGAIALATAGALVAGVHYVAVEPLQGLYGVVLIVLGAVAAVIVWRFICELAALAFLIYARLGEIRDRLRS